MNNTENAAHHQLEVSGMSCGSCVAHVEEALREVEGVREVSVDLDSSRATVTGDSIAADRLADAVVRAGYGVVPPA